MDAEGGVAGEVFAAGHAERGNDLPVLLSTSKAERVDGGYRFTGHKMFGSLTPVWTRLGLHATWTDPRAAQDRPRLPAARLRGSDVETWDTLGMRATRSDDTVLEGAFVPDQYIARILPAGGVDLFILAYVRLGADGFSNVYYGVAQRALDLALPALKNKTSLAVCRSMAYHPEIQHMAAEMMLALEAIGPQLDRIADDWSNGVDHGATWPAKIVRRSTTPSRRQADRRQAMEMSGGAGMYSANELERLYRDVRCGGFHPANSSWCTRSSARRRSASISANSRAGADLARITRAENGAAPVPRALLFRAALTSSSDHYGANFAAAIGVGLVERRQGQLHGPPKSKAIPACASKPC